MTSSFDEPRIRRYLLGELPESEAIALEEEYFSRVEVLQLVRGVEHDLIDAYVAEELPPSEREGFERRYLSAPALRDRVSAARALRQLTPGTAGTTALAFPPARRLTPWRLVASLAALFLLVLGLWRPWPNAPAPPGPEPPPPTIARATPPAPSLPAQPLPTPTASPAATRSSAALVLALSPILARGAGEPAELRLAGPAREVLLEFEGEPGSLPADAGAGLELLVTTVEGLRVWSGPARARALRARPGLLASARLPAGLLKADDYIATLSVRSAAGEPPSYRYFFRVRE